MIAQNEGVEHIKSEPGSSVFRINEEMVKVFYEESRDDDGPKSITAIEIRRGGETTQMGINELRQALRLYQTKMNAEISVTRIP